MPASWLPTVAMHPMNMHVPEKEFQPAIFLLVANITYALHAVSKAAVTHKFFLNFAVE